MPANRLKISARFSKSMRGTTGHLEVVSSEFAVGGEVTECRSGVTSIHLTRVIFLLLEWKLEGTATFPTNADVYRQLRDALRKDAAPHWLDEVFGSLERLRQLLVLEKAGSHFTVGNSFSPDSVEISLERSSGGVMPERDALHELRRLLAKKSGQLTDGARERAIQLATVDLRLSHLTDAQSVLAGKAFWLGKLCELEELIRGVISSDGLLGSLEIELHAVEHIEPSRATMQHWMARADQFIRQLNSLGRFVAESPVTIDQFVTPFRNVQQRAQQWLDAQPPTAAANEPSHGIPPDATLLVTLFRETRAAVDALRRLNGPLVICIAECRDQLEELLGKTRLTPSRQQGPIRGEMKRL